MYHQQIFLCLIELLPLIKIKKKRRPNIEPWGTPDRMLPTLKFDHRTLLFEIYSSKNVLLKLRVDHLYHMI